MKTLKSMGRCTKFLLIAMSAILLTGIFVGCRLFSERRPAPEAERSASESKQLDSNGNAIDGEFVSKTPEEILAELEKAQINVIDKVSASVTFTNGEAGSIGAWVVENSAENTVVMQCEIILNETLLAKTVPIYPDQHISSVKLLTSLSPGTYEVIAYINYFKLDTREYISKAGYKIKLIVQ
ncbi:MAG: hypothetical protein ACYC5K_09315 [Saccharofermentanales bacterium]